MDRLRAMTNLVAAVGARSLSAAIRQRRTLLTTMSRGCRSSSNT
jgi:hypothetical protein